MEHFNRIQFSKVREKVSKLAEKIKKHIGHRGYQFLCQIESHFEQIQNGLANGKDALKSALDLVHSAAFFVGFTEPGNDVLDSFSEIACHVEQLFGIHCSENAVESLGECRAELFCKIDQPEQSTGLPIKQNVPSRSSLFVNKLGLRFVLLLIDGTFQFADLFLKKFDLLSGILDFVPAALLIQFVGLVLKTLYQLFLFGDQFHPILRSFVGILRIDVFGVLQFFDLFLIPVDLRLDGFLIAVRLLLKLGDKPFLLGDLSLTILGSFQIALLFCFFRIFKSFDLLIVAIDLFLEFFGPFEALRILFVRAILRLELPGFFFKPPNLFFTAFDLRTIVPGVTAFPEFGYLCLILNDFIAKFGNFSRGSFHIASRFQFSEMLFKRGEFRILIFKIGGVLLYAFGRS